MPEWALALLLKPIIGAAIVLFVFVLPIMFCRYVLKPIFPEGKIKEYLFRVSSDQGGTSGAGSAAKPDKRLLD